MDSELCGCLHREKWGLASSVGTAGSSEPDSECKTPAGLTLTWCTHLVIPYLLSLFAQALCWLNPIW